MSKQSELYLYSGILERWHDLTWDDFTNDIEAKEKVQSFVSRYDETAKDGVGLYLWGANGVGKSMLMNLAFKDYIKQRRKVQIITLSSLITTFTSAWFNNQEKEKLYSKLLNADVLGIEEIGKEFRGSTDLAPVVLDTIIRFRVQRKMPIWVTTNKKPSDLLKDYTQTIASMLQECSLPLKVVGDDIRNKIANKNIEKYL